MKYHIIGQSRDALMFTTVGLAAGRGTSVGVPRACGACGSGPRSTSTPRGACRSRARRTPWRPPGGGNACSDTRSDLCAPPSCAGCSLPTRSRSWSTHPCGGNGAGVLRMWPAAPVPPAGEVLEQLGRRRTEVPGRLDGPRPGRPKTEAEVLGHSAGPRRRVEVPGKPAASRQGAEVSRRLAGAYQQIAEVLRRSAGSGRGAEVWTRPARPDQEAEVLRKPAWPGQEAEVWTRPGGPRQGAEVVRQLARPRQTGDILIRLAGPLRKWDEAEVARRPEQPRPEAEVLRQSVATTRRQETAE